MRYKAVLRANDRIKEQYCNLASLLCLVEGRDWRCEWSDGGRIIFWFATDELRDKFQTFRRLLEIGRGPP